MDKWEMDLIHYQQSTTPKASSLTVEEFGLRKLSNAGCPPQEQNKPLVLAIGDVELAYPH